MDYYESFSHNFVFSSLCHSCIFVLLVHAKFCPFEFVLISSIVLTAYNLLSDIKLDKNKGNLIHKSTCRSSRIDVSQKL